MHWSDSYITDVVPQEAVVSGMCMRAGTYDGLCDRLGVGAYAHIGMEQVHGTHCEVITASTIASSDTIPIKIPQCDAMITDQPGCVLQVRTADCLPIIVYHPTPIIGVVHAGRRGTEHGILRHTIERISDVFGVSHGFLCWFGPALCERCHQVDAVADVHVDLVSQNQAQLDAAIGSDGYVSDQLSECTKCRSDRYFSYRAGDVTQRNITVAALTQC